MNIKKRNSKYLSFAIVLIVILISIFIISTRGNKEETPEHIAQCIGEKATLYVQLGCHACETQENLFGENIEHIYMIDCYFERDKCGEITHTPTWIIDGEKYIGVQSIDKLRELTGC